MENLTKFDDFKNKKHGSKLNEGVIKIGNEYVLSDVQIPVSLVNSYIKKIKDESGKNLREMMSDQDVAYRLVKYVIENYLQIDNLPSNVVLGDDASANIEVNDTESQVPPQGVQGQETQTQTQIQDTQTQTQDTQTQTQDTQTQSQVDSTVNDIQSSETQGGQSEQTQQSQAI